MNTVELTEVEELALQERDERAKRLLLAELDQMDETARWAAERARTIRAAVRAEEWWTLKGILDEDTIESLCNVSPKGLLDGEEE